MTRKLFFQGPSRFGISSPRRFHERTSTRYHDSGATSASAWETEHNICSNYQNQRFHFLTGLLWSLVVVIILGVRRKHHRGVSMHSWNIVIYRGVLRAQSIAHSTTLLIRAHTTRKNNSEQSHREVIPGNVHSLAHCPFRWHHEKRSRTCHGGSMM